MRRRLVLIVVALVIVASLAGALAAILSARSASRWTDGGAIDAPARGADPRRVLWQPPAPIATLNSDSHEYEPRASADGRWLVFVRGLAGGDADLWIAERQARGWTDPAPIPDLNTDADELGPELSLDARSLYFYSDRPGGLGGYDLWVSRRAERSGLWLAPENLGPRVNSAWNEYGPALDPAGTTLWFASNRPRPDEPDASTRDAWPATIREERARRDYDLYTASLTDAGPEPARRDDSLSTPADEGSPAWSPAGDWIYFASDRPGGLGGHDLYRARPHTGVIEPLQTGVNSPFNESDPALSAGGFELTFSSDRPRGDVTEPGDYDLYSTWSREVRRVTDPALAFAAWRRAIAVALWALLAGLLALLVLLVLRNQKLRARFARLSLLAQCLIVSAIVHALILMLMTVMYVGGAMGIIPGRSGPSRVALVSGSGAGTIATQLRGLGVDADVAPWAPGLVMSAPAPEPPRIDSPEIDSSVAEVAAASAASSPIAAEPPRAGEVPMTHEVASASLPESRERTAEPALIAEVAPVSRSLEGGGYEAVATSVAPAFHVEQAPEPRAHIAPFAAATERVDLPEAATAGVALEERAADAGEAPARGGEVVIDRPAIAIGATTMLGHGVPDGRTPSPERLSAVSAGVAREAPAIVATDAPGIATGGSTLPEQSVAAADGAENASAHGAEVGLARPAIDATGVSSVDEPALPGGATPGSERLTPASAGVASAAVSPGHAVEIEESRIAFVDAALPERQGDSGAADDAPVGREPVNVGGPGVIDASGEAELVEGPSIRESSAAAEFSAPRASESRLAAAASDERPVRLPELGAAWGDVRRSASLPESPPEAPANPFPQRDDAVRHELAEAMGGSAKTEAAVERSLDWLRRHQSADGRWSSREYDDGCGRCAGHAAYDFDSATTGLSLMCMLGAGQTHVGEGAYAESVGRGLEWLTRRESGGDLRGGETMYSQGIATIALAEAYAMTRDERLRGPLERAVGFIVEARHDPTGSWRYEPGQFGDTSVLGWQVMALKSAKNAGIEVPDGAFDAAGRWLGVVAFGEDGLYAYQPGMEATRSMTAEGMFVRQLLGARRDEPRMARSASFVAQEPPGVGVGTTYQWYYGTLALYQHQGDEWARWNEALVATLLELQHAEGELAGSWDPEDRWSRIGGRVYQTAICTLSLEVYYRYLPGFVGRLERER